MTTQRMKTITSVWTRIAIEIDGMKNYPVTYTIKGDYDHVLEAFEASYLAGQSGRILKIKGIGTLKVLRVKFHNEEKELVIKTTLMEAMV